MTSASEYQQSLKSLMETNPMAQADALRQLLQWVVNDKRQFSSYAKRIVLAMSDCLREPKEEVNLLACSLALEIVQLNPRDIEFYIRSKLLKAMIENLGDNRPQVRKAAHYCLLAYIRAYKNFDDLIDVYLARGFQSEQPHLRQKAINSFQSILIMEIKYLNWSSPRTGVMLQALLFRLSDSSSPVQKAAEQCLLSLSKVDQIKIAAQKLSSDLYFILSQFMENQITLGNLTQIKIKPKQVKKQQLPKPKLASIPPITELKQTEAMNEDRTGRMSELQKSSESTNKFILRKVESSITANLKALRTTQELKRATIYKNKELSFRQNPQGEMPLEPASTVKVIGNNLTLKPNLPSQQLSAANSEIIFQAEATRIKKQIQDAEENGKTIIMNASNRRGFEKKKQSKQSELLPQILVKVEPSLQKKLVQDLRNERDWKGRLEAAEELQTKFQVLKEELSREALERLFLPVVIRLLSDPNFKVALIGLKLMEELVKLDIALEDIISQVTQRLTDSKVALRQNASRLIRVEYLRTGHKTWIDAVLLQLRRTSNSSVKEEIIALLSKLFQNPIEYPFENIVEAVAPLMDDLKTKIKIKTLDFLVLITVKTQKFDRIKNMLASKINQIYFEMYLQKISKELRINLRERNEQQKSVAESIRQAQKQNMDKSYGQVSVVQSSDPLFADSKQVKMRQIEEKESTQLNGRERRAGRKTTNGNSTSGSLPRYAHLQSTVRSFGNNAERGVKANRQTAKHTESCTTADQSDFPPFSDPLKELKTIQLELKVEDWQISFEALSKLRRIIHNHSELISHSVLRALIPDVVHLAESLRSGLSKNALIVVQELTDRFKKGLDSDLDSIYSKLIKRALDSNSFISQEVKKALVSLCSHCSESRVMTLLISSHTARALPIKVVVIHILQRIALLPKVFEKQSQSIIQLCVDFMSEGSLQIRDRTKCLLLTLLEANPALIKLIPQQMRGKLQKVEEIKEKKEEISQIKEEEISKPKKRNRMTTFPEAFEKLDSYLQGSESGDWRLRLESMMQVGELAEKYPSQISQHRSGPKVIDVLSKQINDPNAKVALNALKVFVVLVFAAPSLIEASLALIMNEIFTCFACAKPQLREGAEQLYNSIANKVEGWMLMQHLCNGCLYGLAKIKSILLSKMVDLMRGGSLVRQSVKRNRQNILSRTLCPTINKMAEEARPDTTLLLRDLLLSLQQQFGQEVLETLSSKATALLD